MALPVVVRSRRTQQTCLRLLILKARTTQSQAIQSWDATPPAILQKRPRNPPPTLGEQIDTLQILQEHRDEGSFGQVPQSSLHLETKAIQTANRSSRET